MFLSYMEKTRIDEMNPPTLQKLLGDSAIIKVLDFLTLNRRLDYSKADIARNSGVGWKTLFRVFPLLERYKLVKMTRKVGRAQLYRLNMDMPIAKTLSQLALQIADFENEPLIKKHLKKELIEVASQ